MIQLTDEAFHSYLETLLWSSEESEPLDSHFEIWDIHPESYESSKVVCQIFIDTNEADIQSLLDSGDYSLAGILHDFWLNRNGHGVGFWDGDYPEPVATNLDLSSQIFGSVDAYIGDDLRVHVFEWLKCDLSSTDSNLIFEV